MSKPKSTTPTPKSRICRASSLLVRAAYRTGSASFLDFVLGATSFDEFTSNWDLLTQMNNNDSGNVDTLNSCEQLQAP